MRVRVVRVFDQRKCHDVYVVQRWMTRLEAKAYVERQQPPFKVTPEQLCWEPIRDFDLDEYDKAAAYAMDLSMEKKSQAEMVVFDNGDMVVKAYQAPRNCADGGLGVDSAAQTQRGTNEYTV